MILRQEHRRPEERDAEHQHHHVGDGEVPALEQPARRRWGARAATPRRRTRRARRPRRCEKPTMKCEWNQSSSCPLSSTTSSAPRPTAMSAEADVVDAARCAPSRLRGAAGRSPCGSRGTARAMPDRHVDEEDPAPRVVVGDEAAQRRARSPARGRPPCRRWRTPSRASAAGRCRRGSPARSARGRRRRRPGGRGRRSASRSDGAMPQRNELMREERHAGHVEALAPELARRATR